jgi:hypothetical protein
LYADVVLARALKIQQPAVDVIKEVLKNLTLPSYMQVSKVNATVSTHMCSRQTVEFKMNSERVNAEKKSVENKEELTLKDASLKINDALVVNVVLESEVYATAIELAMVELFEPEQAKHAQQQQFQHQHQFEASDKSALCINNSSSSVDVVGGDDGVSEVKKGFMKEVKTINGWSAPMLFRRTGPSGGIGVYCYATMSGGDDGVAFTPNDAYPLVIAFHTQESLSAHIGLQSAWSDYRIANTRKQRDAAVLKAQRLALNVSVPIGARRVRGPKWHSKEFVDPDYEDDVEDDDDDSDEEDHRARLTASMTKQHSEDVHHL